MNEPEPDVLKIKKKIHFKKILRNQLLLILKKSSCTTLYNYIQYENFNDVNNITYVVDDVLTKNPLY